MDDDLPGMYGEVGGDSILSLISGSGGKKHTLIFCFRGKFGVCVVLVEVEVNIIKTGKFQGIFSPKAGVTTRTPAPGQRDILKRCGGFVDRAINAPNAPRKNENLKKQLLPSVAWRQL